MANDSPQPAQLDYRDSAGSTALAVGIVTGLGAVVFRGLIGLVHNVMFPSRLSFAYDSSVLTATAPGCVRHSGSDARRHRRDLYRVELRARSEGPH
jgi:hypothetical protein